MNRLAAILPASNVLVDVDATSKKRAFEHAGLVFENQHAIARATVTDNLFARERLGSTGLGPVRDRRDALGPRIARAPEDRARRGHGAPADRELGTAEVGRVMRRVAVA
jgi:hypothetical protein